MRIYRCFVEDGLKSGERISLPEEEHRHLSGVRRAKAGFQVILLDGKGREFSGVIESTSRRETIIEVHKISREESQPPIGRAVVLGMIKSDDWIASAVELGMTEFFPVLAEFSNAEYRREKTQQRWLRICQDALKQCERLWLPKIHEPKSLNDLLSLEDFPNRIHLKARDLAVTPLAETEGRNQPTAFYIGPEGGWSDQEITMLESAGIKSASIGDSILRAETAVIASLAIFQASKTD